MRWVEHVEHMAEIKKRKLLAIRPESKRLNEKLRKSCKNNIKKDFS